MFGNHTVTVLLLMMSKLRIKLEIMPVFIYKNTGKADDTTAHQFMCFGSYIWVLASMMQFFTEVWWCCVGTTAQLVLHCHPNQICSVLCSCHSWTGQHTPCKYQLLPKMNTKNKADTWGWSFKMGTCTYSNFQIHWMCSSSCLFTSVYERQRFSWTSLRSLPSP